MLIAWIVAVPALFLLGASQWWPHSRILRRPVLRAVVVIAASASLAVIVTGTAAALVFIALDVILVAATWRFSSTRWIRSRWGIVWIAALVLALVAAKLWNTASTSSLTALTVTGPIAWLGVSYFIFRLIHVALDARHGRLGEATLTETLIYALHPATLVAGPIDRLQHSIAEQRCEPQSPGLYIRDALWRLFIGAVKKLAVANFLYEAARYLQGISGPGYPASTGWLWLLVYTFYIYFDFAGYSDIAIGAGLLMGIRLPENFANPYAQPNIARFWQAWHITLSTWLRDYIFFPLSRSLLKRMTRRGPVIFASHMTTMILCGLWHGLNFQYVAWGAWHGFGLFVHSQLPLLRRRFHLPTLPAIPSVVMTFAFVMLGWTFFNFGFVNSLKFFGYLFGVAR